MAKVFKTTIFFVDANGKFEDKEDLINEIERQLERTDLLLHVEEAQESKEFEWHDNLDINDGDAGTFEYDKYLDGDAK